MPCALKFRYIAVFWALIFTSVNLRVYGQLRNIHVTSYKVMAYNVFTDELSLNISVRNDSTDFVIRNFTGLVYQKEDPLVYVTSSNVPIPNGLSTINVKCNISRCSGISLFRLAQCLLPFKISDYTVDVSIAVEYQDVGIQYKAQKGITFNGRFDQQK